MQFPNRPQRTTWTQRFAAGVLALLIAGVLPAVHHHEGEGEVEAHCQDSALTTATHLETRELEHHEPCGLCAKTLSSARLERPQTALVDELVAEHASEGPQVLPPGPPGRHGAARAPPVA